MRRIVSSEFGSILVLLFISAFVQPVFAEFNPDRWLFPPDSFWDLFHPFSLYKFYTWHVVGDDWVAWMLRGPVTLVSIVVYGRFLVSIWRHTTGDCWHQLSLTRK